MQLLDVGMGDRGQARQCRGLGVLRIHAGLAHGLQHAVLAGVVGHGGQAPVAAEHAVQGLQVAHRGLGRIDGRQAAVIAVGHRHAMVARGGGDELPQAGRATAIAGIGPVAAFHERNQCEFGRQVGLAQFFDHVAEQHQCIIILVGQARGGVGELLLPARAGGLGVTAGFGQAVAEAAWTDPAAAPRQRSGSG
ncbi:hypothetical protein G6F50_014692 [Rhizopus delemar]|uniref:Uncharacterized protein n=1 Tax=Rhizopus delemar TaxID=936053 RepID=A0A9P6Y3I0_9FUNG|nr:hypothetical protein G6F50_014692 [Rhizopus delemar]